MLTLPVSCYELGFGWIDRGKPTLCPNIDRMGGAVLQCRVQIFPQYIDFTLQINEHHICITARIP